ncbi:MAG TPA: glutamine synthetase, partial [candidate division Zixibacteria bacterium]
MFRNPREVIKFANQKKIEMIDLKFIDLFGRWHHLSLPKSQLNLDMFKRGTPFDGSATPGFKS